MGLVWDRTWTRNMTKL